MSERSARYFAEALLNSMEDQDGTTAVGDEVPHDAGG